MARVTASWSAAGEERRQDVTTRRAPMAPASSDRFIVRAEIRSAGESVISYGFDLTERSIFVVTEWNAPIGTSVSVRFSSPRILEPIDVAARIGDIRVAGEPGEQGGI